MDAGAYTAGALGIAPISLPICFVDRNGTVEGALWEALRHPLQPTSQRGRPTPQRQSHRLGSQRSGAQQYFLRVFNHKGATVQQAIGAYQEALALDPTCLAHTMS